MSPLLQKALSIAQIQLQATQQEQKKVQAEFFASAKEHHPDRHPHQPAAIQAQHQELFLLALNKKEKALAQLSKQEAASQHKISRLQEALEQQAFLQQPLHTQIQKAEEQLALLSQALTQHQAQYQHLRAQEAMLLQEQEALEQSLALQAQQERSRQARLKHRYQDPSALV